MDLIHIPRPPYKRIGFIFRRKCSPVSPYRILGYISALLIFCYITIYSTTAYPASVAQSEMLKDDPSIPWHITADEVSHDSKNDQYTASGNVVIQKKDRKLTADFIRFDHKTMQALATGDVVMTVGENVLSGTKIELNLNSETGILYGGSIFLKENHFYIKGDKIHKTGKDTYIAERVTISSCDGEHPDWKITGRNLNVTIEGYGSIKHAALWAKKLPVFYTPYLFFPAKYKRQSGLLRPQAGKSSRKGFEYNQPYFWAISDSSDATFYLHHMADRGEQFGTEYRYILDDLSKGTAMFDFLSDRKIDDGTGDSSKKWGYEEDDFLRPNSDRYWLRMKHDQALPFHFSGKLDIDFVSDQDYLQEFRYGYTGYDDTNAYFFDTFGRGLDDFNDPIRVNRLNLNRVWASSSLNAEFRWNDNVIRRRRSDTDPTLQELPFIGYNASKQQISKSPFFFDFNSTYTYFYRQDGTKGHRADAHPRVYLPYKLKPYFAFEPSAGIRETVWYIPDLEDSSPIEDETSHREIYDIKLDLSSDIYNIFRVKWHDFDRLKHALRPQVIYTYIPQMNQDEYPLFNAADRVAASNLITYGLTNIFTLRSKNDKKRDKTTSDVAAYTYRQFSRLKLEQSYDINKEDEEEPFSPISGEFDLAISKYFTLITDAAWSPYETDFISRNMATNFSDKRGDRLFLEHRYTQGLSESIYVDLLVNITNQLSVYSDYERNMSDGKKITSSLGFLYKSQCWSIDVRYTDEETDRRIQFSISLNGLGNVGTSVAGRTIETPFN